MTKSLSQRLNSRMDRGFDRIRALEAEVALLHSVVREIIELRRPRL